MSEPDETQSEYPDSFSRGVAAHRNQLDRHRCPFPQGDVEATRWYAGWDDSAARNVNVGNSSRSEEAWTQSEAILLLTLAAGGERLSVVASRMGKTEDAVRIECKRLNLALADDCDRL